MVAGLLYREVSLLREWDSLRDPPAGQDESRAKGILWILSTKIWCALGLHHWSAGQDEKICKHCETVAIRMPVEGAKDMGEDGDDAVMIGMGVIVAVILSGVMVWMILVVEPANLAAERQAAFAACPYKRGDFAYLKVDGAKAHVVNIWHFPDKGTFIEVRVANRDVASASASASLMGGETSVSTGTIFCREFELTKEPPADAAGPARP